MVDLLLDEEEEALFEKLVEQGYTVRRIRGVIDLEGIGDAQIIRKMIEISKEKKNV